MRGRFDREEWFEPNAGWKGVTSRFVSRAVTTAMSMRGMAYRTLMRRTRTEVLHLSGGRWGARQGSCGAAASAGADKNTVALDLCEIEDLAFSVLRRAGASDEHAAAVAHVVMQAERDGSISHGLFRVPGYFAALHSGKVRGCAQPKVTTVTPALLQCDGDRCFAPLAHRRSLGALENAAKTTGIAALSITRTAHWAALWPEAEWLASRGLVAFTCCSFLPTVAPHGSSTPLFGTNPMSFAWPRTFLPEAGHSEFADDSKAEGVMLPLCLDMATAAMALGDVQLHAVSRNLSRKLMKSSAG